MTIRLLTRTEIRNIARELDFRPRKALGQNFVHDANTLRRIVSSSGINKTDHVLEVGPGMGSLTLALLDRGAAVTAVEIDPLLAARLPKTVAEHSHSEIHRLTVVNHDVLTLHPSDLTEQPTAVVANLPYNIAVPALLHLFCRVPDHPHRHGDGAGRGRRAAGGRTRRQGVRRAQRQDPLLRQRPPLRHGVADGVLADSAGVLRSGSHRPPRDHAVAAGRRLPPAGLRPDRHRLRPAPQDRAQRLPGLGRFGQRVRRAAAVGQHRPGSPGRDADRRRLRPAAAALGLPRTPRLSQPADAH